MTNGEKNFGELDCISRADARSLICDIDRKHGMFGMSRKAFKDLYNGMDDLPSVTPQPTTKNNLDIDDEERELALMYLEQIKEDYIEGVGYERHPLPEYYAIETAIKSLAMPSVTPQSRKRHWIKTPKAVMGEGYMWYCDKCNYEVYQDSSRSYPSENFCPNCGADMREVEE